MRAQQEHHNKVDVDDKDIQMKPVYGVYIYPYHNPIILT